jgi:hypothetical protein
MQHLLFALQKIRMGGSKRSSIMQEIRRRPVHSGFETLKNSRIYGQQAECFNRLGYATNEQMTALGLTASTNASLRLFDRGISR